MPDSVFITKNPGEILTLQEYSKQNNIELLALSFLEFRSVSFELPPHFDVIFFGSPRAVMFFQSRFTIPSNIEIACVGGKTESLLVSMGYTVAFSGEGRGSISNVAHAFKNWLQKRTVLFPVSTRSLGTISKGIPSEQVLTVECYETLLRDKALDKEFETYVFTSPSNVQGFFTSNSIPQNAQIIAWGESTAKELKKNEILEFATLENPSIDSLIEFLSS